METNQIDLGGSMTSAFSKYAFLMSGERSSHTVFKKYVKGRNEYHDYGKDDNGYHVMILLVTMF